MNGRSRRAAALVFASLLLACTPLTPSGGAATPGMDAHDSALRAGVLLADSTATLLSELARTLDVSRLREGLRLAERSRDQLDAAAPLPDANTRNIRAILAEFISYVAPRLQTLATSRASLDADAPRLRQGAAMLRQMTADAVARYAR